MKTSSVFYSGFSQLYARYADRKKGYITAVDEFIKKEGAGARSLIDIGAGDGLRSRRLADGLGIKSITLVDNSEGMVNLAKKIKDVSVITSDISKADFSLKVKYNVVVCLWNVLGHIPSKEYRLTALKNMADLLDENGFLFLDVNNRYNLKHYGIKAVVKNLLKDVLYFDQTTGDFDFSITIEHEIFTTRVHIFSPLEIRRLFEKAGLKVVKKMNLDYCSGQKARSFWGGQLVYKLTRI